MVDKNYCEGFYNTEDPWGYKTNPDDLFRKQKILDNLKLISTGYERALDICCGEAWITQDLPAKEIHGIEIADKAAERFPANVKRVVVPEGKYDLVICTGALYYGYEWHHFIDMINLAATKHILISNISDREVSEITRINATQIHEEEFSYREWKQRLRIFRV